MARIVPGVRNKQKLLQEFCADCGATDPGWSSLNRGILLCDGCCSVHRSLGRHVSQVKPLQKIIWHPTQLSMVHALNNSGANHIWEHMLLDPSTAKDIRHKPQPKDPIHPNKADFIRAKHQMLSFVYRLNKEESTGVDKDVSRQLHASVRTANLETSLRLLSLGADPNYFNAEKGNCPLHVAATAGQSSQVELLVIYGADPGALDDDGQSPVDYAREGCSQELADRLIEFQYELTDRLTFYVCGRKPHHSDNQHWVIPEMADTLIDSAEVSTDARDRLVALPNHSFEELACDVYDEVDRRETDGIWLSLQNQSALLSDRCSVPFLPVNPEYSSTRNQGRQKLARFNAREFATLIIDILVEARRRMADSVSHPHLLAKETVCMDENSSLDHSSSSFPPVPSSSSNPPPSPPLSLYGASEANEGSCGNDRLTAGTRPDADYDEVCVTSDEDFNEDDSLEEGSDESDEGRRSNDSEEEEEEEDEAEKEEEEEKEKAGEGCMSELFSGMHPLISSQKKKKKKKKGPKCSSFGGSVEGNVVPSRYSTATTLSMQVSKHLREKVLGSRSAWSFGDYHPRKLNIVHPPLRSDVFEMTLLPTRSLLLRTLTLPLKLANQKKQSLPVVLSRSQPTSPVLNRKLAAPNHTFSRSDSPNSSYRLGNKKDFSCKSLDCQSELSTCQNYHKLPPKPNRKLRSKSSVSIRRGDPFQTAIKLLPSFSHLSPKTYSPYMTPLWDFSNFHNKHIILEPCDKCAYNVAANIQHASIWESNPSYISNNCDAIINKVSL